MATGGHSPPYRLRFFAFFRFFRLLPSSVLAVSAFLRESIVFSRGSRTSRLKRLRIPGPFDLAQGRLRRDDKSPHGLKPILRATGYVFLRSLRLLPASVLCVCASLWIDDRRFTIAD
jgi:hypothetical protein